MIIYYFYKKNTIMALILFILVNYGIANIVVFGSIFSGLRSFLEKINPSFLGTLFSCMICFPFWSGFALSSIFHLSGFESMSPFFSYGLENIYLSIFLDACLSSGTTWLIHTIQERLEG